MKPARTRRSPEAKSVDAVRLCRQEPSPLTVTEQDIRERAYQIFLARGDVPGSPLQDWLRAEHELRCRPRA